MVELSSPRAALDRARALAAAGARARQPDGITIYPVERLGNQLFTYAAGLAQARRLDCPYYVSLGFFGPLRPQRPYGFSYGLDSFDNGLAVPGDEAAHRPILRGLPVMSTADGWQRWVGRRLDGAVGGVFTEASFAYDPRIERIPVGTTLLGFFQSWRYFDSVAEEVRSRMLRLTAPSSWYEEMRGRIRPGDGSIVLNVRRGDYVLPQVQAFHGLATSGYYRRALELLRDLGIDGPVYVMSDAVDDVLAEFTGFPELVPIRPPRGIDAFELIALLARADALVAANSSFSWWGGWLGERPGRPVVVPRPWFTDRSVDTGDLVPPQWLTLGREL
ncbi:alpha-1,2-fucosyltransferase [Blastococcus tunisiensis]|uniref:Glycosyl transferase family 11 n=1 Tax=Blastococcus tunisiensis TaxID=1798228 RepID=A0A1I2JB91_9ACTN|nr:alpha-1,2-fucosyltransferase [Blastococcus sp. DSM 46838]SFF51260.1 Glycosyl transferase family 11 [Blastococcus sp. DSM 46838]